MEFVDLKVQAELINADIEQAIKQVMFHSKFIMGPEVFELEEKLAEFTGAKHVLTCSSGTDALLMSLMALGIKPGDAVFTTPFTFIATAEVIKLIGAVPIFVDIDKETFNICPDKLKTAISRIKKDKKNKLIPKCIIPVDLFGLPADYDKINKIAEDNQLFVLEDAAQSLGSGINGKKSCNVTDLAATSFFPAKPLGCYGDGGAIFTNDTVLYEILKSIRVHGKGKDKYNNVRLGINGRMDTIQAAILLEKLKIFPDELNKRNKIAQKYKEYLEKYVRFQKIPENYSSAWAQLSFVSEKREAIIKELNANKVPNAIYYPKPLHLQETFSELGYEKGDFSVSEKLSENILSIPMHPYLKNEEIIFISDIIKNVVHK
ncbi:MAG: DegT/DnrJ/EryC1/StrS family aminotransferase [Desulfobacteraceae bacterium]|nr:DegT/DnrJ/EryC1/StrS family aminotransferase [Desulfobacteraceae bacterium]